MQPAVPPCRPRLARAAILAVALCAGWPLVLASESGDRNAAERVSGQAAATAAAPADGAPADGASADGVSAHGCRSLEHAATVKSGALESIPAGAAPELDSAGRIGRVRVVRQQIFDADDPAENNAAYMLANRLHVLSRETAVREQLRIAEGDPYDAAVLREAERILRTFPWLYDARVVPTRQCGEEVEVTVLTRDVWSLVPTGDVNRSGGENSFALGVKDQNLFGRGETLGFFYENGVDRDGIAAFYTDPAVSGGDWALSLFGSDNSDGGRVAINARVPFRSFDDLRSHGFSASRDERIQPLFATGERVEEFVQRSVSAQAYLARSTGRVDGHVRRWTLGVAHFENEFARDDGPLQPLELPDDRQATYPFVSVELLEDEWEAAQNLDLIGRPEDIYLGRRITASVGVSPDALGADDGRVLFTTSWSNALRLTPEWLVSMSIGADGAVTTSDGEAENLVASVSTASYYRQSESFALFASADYSWTRGLTRDQQLLLGGDSGLRGYPQRYQEGDRRVRLRLEERWFSSAHPLRLFRYGAALFADAGRSWFAGDPDDDESGWLANVGVGLRLMPTRFPTESFVHLDLAVPVRRGGRDVEDVQLSLTLRNSF